MSIQKALHYLSVALEESPVNRDAIQTAYYILSSPPSVKLVVDNDSCGNCFNIPFEYSSKEEFLEDLGLYVDGIMKNPLFYNSCSSLYFPGTKINVLDLIENGQYYRPQVYTLEEWWDSNK